MTGSAQCILIFGGTFDPPHLAHAMLPPLVARQVGCDRVLYVPTSLNPLKSDRPTPAAHRLAMLERAVRDIDIAEIDTTELDHEGPSYTVDTLEVFQNRYGEDVNQRLLIGADQAEQFHRWKQPRRILELATPIVMLRPPADRDRLAEQLKPHWSADEVRQWLGWTIDVPEVPVSASAIRERLQMGEETSDMLDPEVEAYIKEHGLYGVTPG